MVKHILRAFFAAVLLLLFAIPSLAVQRGSILVETCGGAVALYRVGSVNGQNFLLSEDYGGETVTFDELLSPNLAAWLDGQSKSGQIKAADLCGKVLFSDLEPGLYLVAHRSAPAGCDPFAPFLLSIPWDGEQWDINIKLPQSELPPVTEDPANPGAWMMGVALSMLGLAVCIRQGRTAGQKSGII